jgi:hypothetical protein
VTRLTDTNDRNRLPIDAAVLHPGTIGSLAILILNDHLGKARWPGLVTGKLSDIAGLIFFPIILLGVSSMATDWRRGSSVRHGVPSTHARAAVTLTACAFVAVKTIPVVALSYSITLGWIQWPFRTIVHLLSGSGVPASVPVIVHADPTDLIALPAVLAALYIGSGGRRWALELTRNQAPALPDTNRVKTSAIRSFLDRRQDSKSNEQTAVQSRP